MSFIGSRSVRGTLSAAKATAPVISNSNSGVASASFDSPLFHILQRIAAALVIRRLEDRAFQIKDRRAPSDLASRRRTTPTQRFSL